MTGHDLLLDGDRDYLDSKGLNYEVAPNGGGLLLVVYDFQLPEMYNPKAVHLLVIIPAGYPNACPDMFWTIPDVKLQNGSFPRAAEHHEVHGGRNWQRWSRHFTGRWRAGIDNMRSYFASVRAELRKGI